MTIEELKKYCQEELHTKIVYRLPRFPDYGVISSPVSGRWVALVMHNADFDAIDLRYGDGAKKLRGTDPFLPPFHLKGHEWVGLMLNEEDNDEIIRKELKRAYQASLVNHHDIIEFDDDGEGYHDVPIFHRDTTLPSPIVKMKDLYSPSNNEEENFYIQGQYMKDFEDHYDQDVILKEEMPSYHKMTDQELRRYFTLRKEFRQHHYPETYNNYMKLYVSEILNLIHVSKKKAYALLKEIRDQYRNDQQAVKRLNGYIHAFELIYFKKNHVFKVTDDMRAAGMLDPLNKVSLGRFMKGICLYTNTVLDYTEREQELLHKVYDEVAYEYHFFRKHIARREIKVLHLLDGVYFGRPMKENRIELNGVNLLYKNAHWYVERYLPFKSHEPLKNLLMRFEGQLRHSRKPADSLDLLIENIIMENATSDSPTIAGMHQLYDRNKSDAENFYRQGVYMQNFSCHEELANHFFPPSTAYEKLTDHQLRCYFSWRQDFFNHQYKKNYAFMFLFVSEIINDIGVSDAKEGLKILHELKQHFPLIRQINEVIDQYMIFHYMANEVTRVYDDGMEYYYVLDPDHLGDDEAIMISLKRLLPGFGTDHCLMMGHGKEMGSLIASIYRDLVKHEDFFNDYIAAKGKSRFHPYPSYLYFERRNHDEEIAIGFGVSYVYQADHHRWYKKGYDSKTSQIYYVSSAINDAINAYYHVKNKSETNDERLTQWVTDAVNRELDARHLEIRDPLYVKKIKMNEVLESAHQALKITDPDEFKQFISQGQALADLNLRIKPPYVYDQKQFRYYSSLNDQQMLTYIYVRTCIRQGKLIQSFHLEPYFRLYASEVINGIGIKDEKEGLQLLERIAEHDLTLKHVPLDYVLMHHLDGEMMESFKGEDEIIIFFDPELTEPDELFEHINAHSGALKPKRSPLYRSNPQRYMQMMNHVICGLFADEKLHFRSRVLAEKIHEEYHPFANLVYQDSDQDFEDYEITPIRKFYRHDGKYYYDHQHLSDHFETYFDVVHEIERHAREMTGIKKPLKARKIDEDIDQAIIELLRKEMTDQKKQEEKKKIQKVQIHFEDLNQIRDDAAMTTEQLLTEEEKEEAAAEEKTEEEVLPDLNLNDDERYILSQLMKHQPIADYVKEHHLMLSVVIDDINEKLFDEIGDNVIIFEDDQPAIVDDYIEDIQEL